MSRSRAVAAAAAVLLSLAIPSAGHAQAAFWDFVGLNLAPAFEGAGKVAYTTPPGRTVTKVGYGSATFTAELAPGIPNSTPMVVFAWFNYEKEPNDEKGVGACRRSDNPADSPTPCYTSPIGEVGESPETRWLKLELALTAGSILQSITLASLQPGETYLFQICTDSLFVTCSSYGGVGAGSLIRTVAVNPLDQSRRWLRFGAANPQVGSYLVQGITTVVPEPGTMALLATGLVALAGAGSLKRRTRKR